VEDLAGATADGVDDDVDPPEAVDGLLTIRIGVLFARRVTGDREAFGARAVTRPTAFWSVSAVRPATATFAPALASASAMGARCPAAARDEATRSLRLNISRSLIGLLSGWGGIMAGAPSACRSSVVRRRIENDYRFVAPSTAETQMALDLDGLIPATVLPMHADGSIDEPALREYIAWVVAQGPVALAINVDTGEGPHLTHDEKVRISKVVRDVTDLPIVAGLAGPSTDAAVRQARDFKAAGADALLVFPDPGLPEHAAEPSGPVAYHTAIAEVGLPLILFQLQPALAGVNYENDVLEAMADGRWRGRDQGGVVRRPPVRRHGTAARAAAEEDHAAHRQRQLHPRVVPARRDRRADRLRRGHDQRAGRHDPGLAGGPHRRGDGARAPRPAARGRRVRAPVGDYRVRLKECCASSVCSTRPRPPPAAADLDDERTHLADVLDEVGLLTSREPLPRSSTRRARARLEESLTRTRGRPDHRRRAHRAASSAKRLPRPASASSASSRATGWTGPTTRATSSTGS
jgi:hypothetical protein